MNLKRDMLVRLNKFFYSYRKKISFLKRLSYKQKAQDEIILLSSCYLDQLGNCLFPKAGSSKRSFERILLEHSGETEEFSLISVSDLAFDLFRIAEFSYFLIEKSGRIKLYSSDDKSLIKFIDQTDIDLSARTVYKFIRSIYEMLKSRFRIHPYQTSNKNCHGSEDEIIQLIITNPKIKKYAPDINEQTVKNLIEEYRYASILYKNYRCKIVHEVAGISIHPSKFWKNRRPYFVQIGSSLSRHGFFKLEFPFHFLIEVLETCLECAEKAIIGKGLIPPPIFYEIGDIDKEYLFLDVEGLEEPRSIKLNI